MTGTTQEECFFFSAHSISWDEIEWIFIVFCIFEDAHHAGTPIVNCVNLLLFFIFYFEVWFVMTPCSQPYQQLGLLSYLEVSQWCLMMLTFFKVFPVNIHTDTNPSSNRLTYPWKLHISHLKVPFLPRWLWLWTRPFLIILKKQDFSDNVNLSETIIG